MSKFETLSATRPYLIFKGAVARAVNGERATLAVIDLDPDTEIPEHHHENEQIGLVLKGHVTMVIGGEAREFGAGGAYVIPSNVPHSATTASDGATVIDMFAPVRADWASVPRGEPGPGRWP